MSCMSSGRRLRSLALSHSSRTACQPGGLLALAKGGSTWRVSPSIALNGYGPAALGVYREVVIGSRILRVDGHGLAAAHAKLVGDGLVIRPELGLISVEQVGDEVSTLPERRAVVAVADRQRLAVDVERRAGVDAV